MEYRRCEQQVLRGGDLEVACGSPDEQRPFTEPLECLGLIGGKALRRMGSVERSAESSVTEHLRRERVPERAAVDGFRHRRARVNTSPRLGGRTLQRVRGGGREQSTEGM